MVTILVLVLAAAAFYLLFAWRKNRWRQQGPGELVVMTERAEKVGYESCKKGYPRQSFDNAPIDSPSKRRNFEAYRDAYGRGWERAEKEMEGKKKPEPPKPSRSREVLRLVK